MKAIRAHAFGGPDVLQLDDLPEPTPGPGQVRVRLHAAGVNPFDTYMLTGTYAIKPALPYSPGCDGAGVVEAVGDGVAGLAPGHRVYTGGTVDHKAYGAYRQIVLCHPGQVHPLPDRLAFSEGAAVNVPCVTAFRALDRATPAPGDTLLVHGASGAVGLAAVQLARAAGLTVIGSAGSDDGLALVAAEGAHHAVDHRDPQHVAQVMHLTGGRGPDVILEMLANVNLDHDLTMLAPRGRVVVVGNRGRIEIDPRKIMGKEAAVHGMAFWNQTEAELQRAYDGVDRALASGALRPVVGLSLPLAEAAESHRRVMAPGARGKIVLVTE
ncbi:MAG: NADPH:quinone reductase [Vicinamibacterales bacterium]